jgi:1-phosphatidylinositol phosphodiesterase
MRSTLKSSLHVSVMTLALILSLPGVSYAHDNPAYSHDAKQKTSNPSWMTSLKDDTLLSQLSIPGTHDSMAFYGGDLAQTQSMPLANQLKAGIRVLDIRCRHIDDVFTIHHGDIYQKEVFGDVLNTVKAFLADNPGETVLMRVKEEKTAKRTTRSFRETFEEKYWNLYKSYMYQGTSSNPKLGDVRGKIVILQNWVGGDFGIAYPSAFTIQDDYDLENNWDLWHKWTKVKDHLKAANEGSSNTIYMNYLSGATKDVDLPKIEIIVFPYFVASGHSDPRTDAPRLRTGKTTPGWKHCCKDFPRIDCAIGICSIAFEGTNVLTYERLGTDYKTRVGIIMADFPGPGLIERIIELNDTYKK